MYNRSFGTRDVRAEKKDWKIGARTADTPHTTPGRALACGAVWEEEGAPRCPKASRTPARPQDAPYTLQIAHKKSKQGRKLTHTK